MPDPSWDAARCAAVIAAHGHLDGATLPIFHALQESFGYVPDGAVPMVAEALNLSRAEILGTLTFYHDFRRAPAGRHVVKLCRAEACQSVGAVALADHARRSLGIDWHGTSADGRVTLEPAFCLGLCACGPAALVDGRTCRAARCGALRHGPGGADPMTRLFVPGDAVALALGAERVAAALRHALPEAEIVRTGSRGLVWLEPMVEVETPEGRVAYGPVSPADVASLLAAGLAEGGPHPLRLGPADAIPFLQRQTRLTFARCGIVDPRSPRRLRGARRLARPGPRDRDRPARHGRHAEGLRPARPRRRRLPDRDQVVDGPTRRSGAEIRRLQRRRGRQRHLRRPHADGRRSLLADRRHDHRGSRGRRDQGLRLYPLRISARRPGDAGRHRGCRSEPPSRPLGDGVGNGLHAGGPGRRRRLYLRRGDLAARQPRRQARRRAGEAAPAGDPRACSASRPSSTTCSRSRRPVHPRRGRRGLRAFRHGPLARHAAGAARRQRQARRPDRDRLRHDAAHDRRGVRRRHPLRAGRCAPCRSAARSAAIFPTGCSTPRSTTRPLPRPAACSAMAGSWCSTTRSTSPARRASPSSSARRRAAASARPAGSARPAASRTMDRVIAGIERERNLALVRDLCGWAG